jgi:hypothetical protein
MTFVMFLYEDIQWGDSDTSIGFNAGDGERFFTLMTAGVLDLESSSNVGIPGTFLFRVDQSVEVPGKLKPQLSVHAHSPFLAM